jgi:hypothetical protein
MSKKNLIHNFKCRCSECVKEPFYKCKKCHYLMGEDELERHFSNYNRCPNCISTSYKDFVKTK